MGLLDGTEFTDVSNLDTNLYASFSIPENLQESSLDVSNIGLSNQNTAECNPFCEVIRKSSQKGKDVLIEKVGYSYVINLRRNTVYYWRCSIRNNSVICPAKITQSGSMFTRSYNEHNHPANPVIYLKTRDRQPLLIKEPFLAQKKDQNDPRAA